MSLYLYLLLWFYFLGRPIKKIAIKFKYEKFFPFCLNLFIMWKSKVQGKAHVSFSKMAAILSKLLSILFPLSARVAIHHMSFLQLAHRVMLILVW